MTRLRWRLILNGKSADDAALHEAVSAMRERGVDLDTCITDAHDDPRAYADRALDDGIDTLVAAGGDGTLSALASALADRDVEASALPSLGLVPMGTANDFAMAAGIPDHPLAALELIQANAARPIDLVRLDAAGGRRWAVNMASGGFGTQVTVDTHDGLKKLLGGLSYLITGLARLGSIEPIAARITGEDFEWSGDFIALGIGNGRRAGGGHALCPEARIDDGLLDITIVPELDGEMAATIGTVITEGSAAALERVAVQARLRSVEIEAPRAFVLNLDGEPVQSSRFHVECVPRRLRMHLPADCPLLSPRL